MMIQSSTDPHVASVQRTSGTQPNSGQTNLDIQAPNAQRTSDTQRTPGQNPNDTQWPIAQPESEPQRDPASLPKIIHRIWLDDPMPEEFKRYGQAWRELHPTWRFWEWRSSDHLPELINQSLFNRAKHVCPKDWKRFQADLVRLELLNLYGGVYVDTDVEPLKPFDDLLDDRNGAFVAWSPNRSNSGKRLLTQAVIASVPQHPFIQRCIEELPDAVKQYRGRPLAQMAGPHHLTRVWRKGGRQGLTVYPPQLFYPQSNFERDRGQRPRLDGAYAWHRWATSRDRQR